MQGYVDQLVEDIYASLRPGLTHALDAGPETLEDELEEIERFFNSEPLHTFSYYCGLTEEQFPDVGKLSENQAEAIVKSFQRLLHSYNLAVDLPPSMPPRISYPFIISTLSQRVELVTDGVITLEFCTCDPASCPFKTYCTCLRYFSTAEHWLSAIDDEEDEDA